MVAVGYSSQEVSSLLESLSNVHVITFDETTFINQLRPLVLDLALQKPAESIPEGIDPRELFEKILHQL